MRQVTRLLFEQDRKIMMDKIRRERAAVYNDDKQPRVYWRPVQEHRVVSFAESLGWATRRLGE